MIVEKLQTENNLLDYSNLSKSILSIQISLDGFVYCVFDKDLVDVVLLKDFTYSERIQTSDQLLQNIQDIFEKETILNEKFESVFVSYKNGLSTLVPNELFDENHLSSYLKYGNKLLGTDKISVDNIESLQIKNVFIPFININNFLKERFENFRYFHSSTILLSSLLKYYKTAVQKHFFINVSEHILELVYVSNGQLQFYNSFNFHSKEDFIYYVLFSLEQLSIDPEEQPITLIGDIQFDSPLYKIAYKYIRYINFLNINNFSLSEEFYLNNSHIPRHSYFELLNQF